MHTLARPLVRENRLHLQSGSRAFTLIELLTVIGIIAILSAITFGVVKGVQERAAIGQAKAELSIIAQALEGYKRQYGDYPKSSATNVANATTPSATDGPGILFNALAGKLGPTGAAIEGKTFLEFSRFTLQSDTAMPVAGTSTSPNTASVANALVDPWGRRYLYYYKTSATWTAPGFVLLSVGPSVASTGAPGIKIENDGSYSVPTADAANEADNIYSGK